MQFRHQDKRFRPFVGAGVGWAQELDLYLESGCSERSYFGDGDIAWQVMAGVETNLAGGWRLQGELRHSRVSGIDLDEEGGAGKIRGLDYDTWSVNLGLVYDLPGRLSAAGSNRSAAQAWPGRAARSAAVLARFSRTCPNAFPKWANPGWYLIPWSPVTELSRSR
jgi:hypothetical protein